MASLDKYSGTWNKLTAAHLLRRTTFGVNIKTIKSFGQTSMDACMDILFKNQAMPDPPINYSFTKDLSTPIGKTWINQFPNPDFNFYRNQSLRVWYLDLLMSGIPNIREKMTLFWHNHFVTSNISSPSMSYKYISLLRSSALGNFKQLCKDITIDPAMLIYLNGKDSTGKAPNENFGREFLELFSIGKGDLIGPGDYTNYTEEDVKQLARGFTGWVNIANSVPPQSEFKTSRHDTGTKTLSYRFGKVVIPNAGENEYKNIIDIIFQQEAVAEFIATKLYRWFVYFDIDDDIRQNIIKPMAAIIRQNNYEVAPALQTLLSSEHFYDSCVVGRLVKSPMDFIFSPINHFEIPLPTEGTAKVKLNTDLFNMSLEMQMAIFQIPSVGGWPAFYQEPAYNRLWLNAVSLTKRKIYTDALNLTGFSTGKSKILINQLSLLAAFDNPDDVKDVIEQYVLLLLPKLLTDNQKQALYEILNTGSEGDWKKIYAAYKDNSANPTLAKVVNLRLQQLVLYIMRMPEYHLS